MREITGIYNTEKVFTDVLDDACVEQIQGLLDLEVFRDAQKKIEEMKVQGQLGYGIVFCGGGAKGAFQLGVWKKLDELGVVERFTGISGASVGALNALLFAQGDYQMAETAWMKMKKGDLKQPNEVLLSNVLNALLSLGMGNPPASQVINILIN